MRLSIVMPVYNEIATIAKIIRQILEVPVEVLKELIIVENGLTA